jgi:hypothetical protein
MKLRYRGDPHPHLVVEELMPPAVYAATRFPDALVADDEWGITSSDARYAEVLATSGWRALHDELRSETFVREVFTSFRNDMRAAGCRTDPGGARLVDFEETREQKSAAVLAHEGDPNEVFTRLDFQSKAEGGYRDFVHLDWPRRIVGGILFFCDAEEEGLEGGELAFYRDRGFRNDRWCHDPELTRQYQARHNTGVIFLNSNTGFHGPRRIRRLVGRRRWLYFTVSSTVDVWPCSPRES